MRNLYVFLLIFSLFACNGSQGPSQEGNPENDSTQIVDAEPIGEGKMKELEDAKWQLVSLQLEGKSQEIPEDEEMTMILRRGRASGVSGCNTFTGTYELTDGTNLSISDVATTKKHCRGKMMREQIYLDLLSHAESINMNEDRLNITASKGQLHFVKI